MASTSGDECPPVLGSAPALTRHWMTLRWPRITAKKRGDEPLRLRESKQAPLSRSSCTRSGLPWAAALCRGVSPAWRKTKLVPKFKGRLYYSDAPLVSVALQLPPAWMSIIAHSRLAEDWKGRMAAMWSGVRWKVLWRQSKSRMSDVALR